MEIRLFEVPTTYEVRNKSLLPVLPSYTKVSHFSSVDHKGPAELISWENPGKISRKVNTGLYFEDKKELVI